jgi:hypothetical protein
MKTKLLDSLHILLSNNVIGTKQYNSRYIGFRSELQTLQFLRKKGKDLIEGAYLIPMKKHMELFECPSILFMVGNNNQISDYNNIFLQLSRIRFESMYFISISENTDDWVYDQIDGINEEVIIPQCTVYGFDEITSKLEPIGRDLTVISNKFRTIGRRTPLEKISENVELKFKDQLGDFDIAELTLLYTERFIFDGLIGFGSERGIPTDIDGIVREESEFTLLEIKEKDVSKREPVGFGMDVRRISQLKGICRRTSMPLEVVIRQIKDQTSRDFMQYMRIDFYDFYKQTSNTPKIEGGHGMRSEKSSNPTQICPFVHFSAIN